MKITPEQEELLRSMCMERKSNKEIAEAVGIHVAKVHAWRFRNKLTRKKVDTLLAAQKVEKDLFKDSIVDPILPHLLDSCEWQLDKVITLIFTAAESCDTCSYCSHLNTPEGCTGTLLDCAAATAAHIRAKVGEGS